MVCSDFCVNASVEMMVWLSTFAIRITNVGRERIVYGRIEMRARGEGVA